MDNTLLYEFCTAVEFKSISKAAEYLFTSQPTLSRHISLLEKELGHRLIDRSSHHFGLTEAGEAFYRHASVIVRQYRMLIQEVRAVGTIPYAHGLTVSMPDLSCPPLFAAFRRFHRLYPDSSFAIHKRPTEFTLVDIASGTNDLGVICSCEAPGLADDPAYETCRIGTDIWCAVLPEGDPAAGRSAVSLTDLADRLFISCPHIRYGIFNQQVPDRFRFQTPGPYPDGHVRELPLDNIEAVFMNVQAGLGTAVMPRSYAERRSGIVSVPLADMDAGHDLIAFCRSDRKADYPGLDDFWPILLKLV